MLLETADGKPRPRLRRGTGRPARPARARVKLVTGRACWSAALGHRRTPPPAQPAAPEDQETIPHDLAFPAAPHPPPATWRPTWPRDSGAPYWPCATRSATNSRRTDRTLYDLLARQGQPLPSAVRMTLRQLLTGTRFPALSAAPALFGATATELRSRHGSGPPGVLRGRAPKLAGFPPQPDRFVGRTGVMARASAALAAESGIPGVLLHGMPGGGKTACALELAYSQEARLRPTHLVQGTRRKHGHHRGADRFRAHVWTRPRGLPDGRCARDHGNWPRSCPG